MNAPPRMGVVVVNYSSHALLAANLVPLGVVAGLLVVVVDNFSSSAERRAVNALAADHGWDVVAPEGNGGYGDGNNRGLQRARDLGCDVVLLLNPDARIAPADCLRLGESARRAPRSLISPVVVRPDGSTWFSGSEFVLRTGRLQRTRGEFVSGPTSWLSGACLVASSSWWAELGGFTDGYFMYWEDVDLSRRCVDAGGTLVVERGVRVVHDAGGTQISRGAGKSALYYRYNCRNRLLFAAAHLDTGDLLRWVVFTPQESARILSRGGRRQFITSPGVVLSALRGTAEGLGIVAAELLRRGRRRWSARFRPVPVRPTTQGLEPTQSARSVMLDPPKDESPTDWRDSVPSQVTDC